MGYGVDILIDDVTSGQSNIIYTSRSSGNASRLLTWHELKNQSHKDAGVFEDQGVFKHHQFILLSCQNSWASLGNRA